MLFPPKSTSIAWIVAITLLLAAQDLNAQSASQYQARAKAIQAARARAQAQTQPQETQSQVQQVQYAEPATDYGVDHVAPPQPQRIARRTARLMQQRVTSQTGTRYTPQHLRTAQLSETPIVEGAPVEDLTGSTTMAPSVARPSYGGCQSGNCTGDCGGACIGDSVDHVFAGGGRVGGCGWFGGGHCDDVCGGCDAGCGDPCYDRGGCPPGMLENCWINGLGAFLYNGEYFAGATGFRSGGFNIDDVGQFDDCSFGYYGGVNFGLPLCRLTCGLLSAQFGVRSVNTNFHGNDFTAESRDQLFITTGVYRRVDYGLQAGLVADILHEEWFTESDVIQLRGDVGWVYGNGTTFGFRWTSASSDDVTSGVINGQQINGLTTSVIENYRFYCNRPFCNGGNYDLSLGWSDDDHFVAGIDFDIPVAYKFAVQSGFTWLSSDNSNTGLTSGNDQDVWNLYVGLSWRPRSANWYRFYDRPLFNVADNGTMLIRR